ncbi:hypothetical protein SAMN05192552_103614 [Natrinema hispanicum]|uniref:Polyprenyl synthetase n=1 Tax=Natrinema hispanicum TaxID=392421 RepID=A0A1G6WFP0_9EURY|nr:hypothetical protein SAMN05192552_103614 [Natrinema hispanicum]SEU06910.1 hypothetical protein SAMN04488694_13613 [Natrinema hispanicum]
MTDPVPLSSSQIDRQLESVLSDTEEAGLPLVREVLQEPRDRWYGQLVGHAYASLTDTQDPEIVLPAATGVELLRGYVRLRNRLFVTLSGKGIHSLTLEPAPALLAGDYLYTAAFTSLRSIPDVPSSDCFEVLTTVLGTITEAFTRVYTSAESASYDPATFLDETAGSLGKGAAVLGATLAGVDDLHRRHFARFGSGLSTVRQVDRVLEVNPKEAMVVLPMVDESQLRIHAQRRQDDADRALDALSKTTDVTGLTSFTESKENRANPGGYNETFD